MAFKILMNSYSNGVAVGQSFRGITHPFIIGRKFKIIAIHPCASTRACYGCVNRLKETDNFREKLGQRLILTYTYDHGTTISRCYSTFIYYEQSRERI